MLFLNTYKVEKNTTGFFTHIKPYLTFLLVFIYVAVMIYAILYYINAGDVQGNILMFPTTIASIVAFASFWVTYRKKR